MPVSRSREVRAKRTIDLVVASSLVVVLGPLMLAIALAIRVAEGAPALFRQIRVGLDGRPFTILKFRTMREPLDADEAGASAARITPLGALLRRTSLDELPQLLNVVRGEMSLVGPRPDLPHHVERYTSSQRRRLAVRPGITGWAQVQGRNELSWPERIELDLGYLEGWSLGRDWLVLRRTVALVLSGRGTPIAG